MANNQILLNEFANLFSNYFPAPVESIIYICVKLTTMRLFKLLTLGIGLMIAATPPATCNAQPKEKVIRMLNPSNAAYSTGYDYADTTYAATAYYFNTGPINNVKSISIHCYGIKDSGAVSGNGWIEGSMDGVVYTPLLTLQTTFADDDSLTLANSDNSKFWSFPSVSPYPQPPAPRYYRAKLNVAAISKSRFKCIAKAKLEN